MEVAEKDLINSWIILTAREVNHGRQDLRDDLIQEGWVSALVAYDSYEEEKGYSLKSWIIQALRRDMVRFLENERKHSMSSQDIHIEDILDEDGWDELTDYEVEQKIQSQADIWNLVAKLPEREAIVIEMFYLSDNSEQEIADMLGISRSMIQKIRLRAVANLQQLVGCQ